MKVIAFENKDKLILKRLLKEFLEDYKIIGCP
jgi:hypothetical protein